MEARTQGTAIVTGASRGIGAGVTKALMGLGYNVVANALHFADSSLSPGGTLAFVEGNIGQASTALKVAQTAISRFGSIDAVVANAGIFVTKPFTEYTPEDFQRLSETNIEGYLYITQLAVKQMLAQKRGGSVICMTSAMVRHPLAGVRASVAMLTKGGLEAITLSLALEYAKDRIRFNAIAPGVVDTSMHADASRDDLENQSPMGEISEIQDIVDAVLYLTGARHVTGEVLHVDAGEHTGKW